MQHMKGCWFIEAPISRKICIGTKYLKKIWQMWFCLVKWLFCYLRIEWVYQNISNNKLQVIYFSYIYTSYRKIKEYKFSFESNQLSTSDLSVWVHVVIWNLYTSCPSGVMDNNSVLQTDSREWSNIVSRSYSSASNPYRSYRATNPLHKEAIHQENP